MRRASPWSRVALALAVLAVTACATPAVPTPDDDGVVEVFSNLRGPDADAFREVLATFTERSGVPTRHVGTVAFAARLDDRVRAGDAPDVALVPQPAVVAQLTREGQLAPLDDVVGDREPEYLPGLDGIGRVDGRRMALPFRLSLQSLVWYPPAAFRDAGYEQPDTWGDLLTLTGRIAEDGTTPWCVGMNAGDATGWVGTDWVEDLVLRMHGPEVYDSWVDGEVAFASEPISASFTQFGRIARNERWIVGGAHGALATPVEQSMDPMFDETPGCLLARRGSDQRAFLPDDTTIGPDGDVDVFPLPPVRAGDAPLLVSGQLAVAFADDDRTRGLLAHLADPDAGRPWAARGGFVSPHADFDAQAYDDGFDARVAQALRDARVVRFDGSDQMPPAVGTGTFWTGIVDYVSGTGLPTVLDDIDAGYDDGA